VFFYDGHVFSLGHADPITTQVGNTLAWRTADEPDPWEVTLDLGGNFPSRTVNHNALKVSLSALLPEGL
jgi:hypothetical protein